ncbi:MAG: hypothetical protein ACOYKM_02850 [Caulobacterales bacterium]|jgi:hypothetical protein
MLNQVHNCDAEALEARGERAGLQVLACVSHLIAGVVVALVAMVGLGVAFALR